MRNERQIYGSTDFGDGDRQRLRQIAPAMGIDEFLIIERQIVEVALEQNIASQQLFDGGLLRMRTGDGDAALTVADQLDGLHELDACGGKLLLDSLLHGADLKLERVLLCDYRIG